MDILAFANCGEGVRADLIGAAIFQPEELCVVFQDPGAAERFDDLL